MSTRILSVALVLLTVVTALIHLGMGIAGVLSEPDTLSVLFVLNGISYFLLLGAIFLDIPFFREDRASAHYLLILFAFITFVLYFVLNWPDVFGVTGMITKVDELLLIIVAFLRMRTLAPAA